MAAEANLRKEALQRRLDARQNLADNAVAALAHGRRTADRLYQQLSDLEDDLADTHPKVFQGQYGNWAARDADQLAHHQSNTQANCDRCQAATAASHATANLTLTA